MRIERAETMAIDLIKYYLGDNWLLTFDRFSRRFGACYFPERRISLSRGLVQANTEERVIDTILHEIAHALCPMPAVSAENLNLETLESVAKETAEYKKTTGHTSRWRLKCLDIGGTGEARYSTSNTMAIPIRSWVATCPGCHDQKIIKRQNPPRGLCCGGCGTVLAWTHKKEII